MNQRVEIKRQGYEARTRTERPVTNQLASTATLAPTVYCPPQHVEECVADALRDRRPA